MVTRAAGKLGTFDRRWQQEGAAGNELEAVVLEARAWHHREALAAVPQSSRLTAKKGTVQQLILALSSTHHLCALCSAEQGSHFCTCPGIEISQLDKVLIHSAVRLWRLCIKELKH